MLSLKNGGEMVQNGHSERYRNTADNEKPQTSAEARKSNTVSAGPYVSSNRKLPEKQTQAENIINPHQRQKAPRTISTGAVKRAMEAIHIEEGQSDRQRDGSKEKVYKRTTTTINNQSIEIDTAYDDPLNVPKQLLYDGIIRVGRDYQAVLPTLVSTHDKEMKREDIKDRDLLVWRPPVDVDEAAIEEYLRVARDEHGYNDEQACGLLFWHKHNLRLSFLDLPKFTPGPEEFTDADKILFEQALRTHGKHFRRIHQTLPHKSIPSLVKYFYTRKIPAKNQPIDRSHLRRNKARKDVNTNVITNSAASSVGNEHSNYHHHCCDNSGSNEDTSPPLSSSSSRTTLSPSCSPPLEKLFLGDVKNFLTSNKRSSI